MDCSCEIYCDVEEGSAVLSDKMVKARKPRKCHECYRMIQPGETYRRESTLDDGHFDRAVTCLDCNSLREQFFTDFFYGMIRELVEDRVSESYGDVPEACISKLTPAAREWVCDLVQEQHERYGDES